MANYKRKISMKKFKKAAEGSGGILTTIAKRLEVARSTLWHWLQDPDNAQAHKILQNESDKIVDLAENRLFKQIDDGEQWAVKFLLKTKGRNRGYVEKQEVEHMGEVVNVSEININIPESVKEILDKSDELPSQHKSDD